jgi:hypothetical protein
VQLYEQNCITRAYLQRKWTTYTAKMDGGQSGRYGQEKG